MMSKFAPLFLKNILVFTLCIFILFFYSIQKVRAENQFSSIENLKKSTAQVWVSVGEGKGGIASGFFITENLLVTNYHVVAGSDMPFVVLRTEHGGDDIGEILVTEPRSDLAIIQALFVNNHQPVTLGDSTDINRGDNVFSIGSPEGQFGTVLRDDVISKIGGEFFWTSALGRIGESGSPMFSEDLGTVVGIHMGSGRFFWGETFVSGRYAISVDRLKVLIEKSRETLENATGVGIDNTLYERSLPQGYDFHRDIETKTDFFVMKVITEVLKDPRKEILVKGCF